MLEIHHANFQIRPSDFHVILGFSGRSPGLYTIYNIQFVESRVNSMPGLGLYNVYIKHSMARIAYFGGCAHRRILMTSPVFE